MKTKLKIKIIAYHRIGLNLLVLVSFPNHPGSEVANYASYGFILQSHFRIETLLIGDYVQKSILRILYQPWDISISHLDFKTVLSWYFLCEELSNSLCNFIFGTFPSFTWIWKQFDLGTIYVKGPQVNFQTVLVISSLGYFHQSLEFEDSLIMVPFMWRDFK